MDIKSSEKLLDNERVRFFLRRISERAAADFRKMLQLTIQTHGSQWQQYWQVTLPRIKTWSYSALEKIAEEFEQDVRNVKLLTDFTYLRYACLSYGKDAYGRKNKLDVEMITFSTLYHAFLIRLAKTPEMISASCLTKSEEMMRISEYALSDALHDVSETRVSISPADAADTSSKISTVMSAPRREPTVVSQAYLSQTSAALVTHSDSASQINSIGVRHRNRMLGESKLGSLAPLVPPCEEEEEEDEHEKEEHAAVEEVRVPAPPRIIAFNNNIIKSPVSPPEKTSSLLDDTDSSL